ncbi:hypothetical protein FR864_16280 [Citrobacter freundii]|nr:hypothetical protein FR864_16280 [Citrobacter freundii]QFI28389.1 hypothetical protein FR801_16365 [Citrobacter freundii]
MVGFQLNLIVFDCQAARGTISTLTSNTGILLVLVLVLVYVIDFFSSKFQATKTHLCKLASENNELQDNQ